MSTPSDAALAAPPRHMSATTPAEEFHPPYRPDIDGLRAVAVLAVVVFHFFPTELPGGFVGVDVFFVISGYLISLIILGSLERNSFSLAGFYARRIRRLFPALVVVLAGSLAFGWMALFPGEFAYLGEHVAAGAAFISNIVLWGESGYFDKAAITKPLQHLWSLGVEEQFYILWPVLLALAWRWRFKLVLVAGGIAVLSFVLSIVATYEAPVAAFYSPLTRFWELMIGAMLACLEMHRSTLAKGTIRPSWDLSERPQFASFLSMLGGALILAGVVFTSERNFPGWQALVPVTGTALLLFAGPAGMVNRTALSLRILLGLGLISYPLYLWHWPLLSFTRIVHGEPGTGTKWTLLLTAVILAALTHRLVERPLKAMRQRGLVIVVLVALMGSAGVAGMLVLSNGGLARREVAQANAFLAEARIPHRPRTAPCPFVPAAQRDILHCRADTSRPRFALLGDSKAEALFPGLLRTADPGGSWITFASGKRRLLVPVLSNSPIYAHVDSAAVDLALQVIEGMDSIETVVIATAARALFRLANDNSIADLPRSSNGKAALEGLDATVSRLVAAGKRVILIVDHPTLPQVEDCVARKTSFPPFNRLLATAQKPDCQVTVARHLELSRPYRELLEEVRRRHPGQVTLFDTLPVLCDAARNLCSHTLHGEFLYGHTDHLSEHASRLVGRHLDLQLNPQGAHRDGDPQRRSSQGKD